MATIKNQTRDCGLYRATKALPGNEDKVPAEVKDEVAAAVSELKEKLKTEDSAAIREATEKLSTTSQKLGQALYAQAGEGAAAAGGPSDAPHDAGHAAEDDVVDAEIVDDEKRDGGAA